MTTEKRRENMRLYMRERSRTPEYKAQRKAYNQEYNQRPEVKAMRREYAAKYYRARKLKQFATIVRLGQGE